MENIGILDAGIIALLGYAVVFFGLILLMIVVTIMGKFFTRGEKKVKKAPAAAPAGATTVNAPMPGTILDIKVSAGQAVKKGDLLVILEAMKMENEIMAPCDGTIASVNATKGASVNSGDLLVSIG